jgi:sensor c-di-GMP phosphodiesterase-like protein
MKTLELLPEDLVKQITGDCKKEHQKLIQEENHKHLKAVKKVIRFWVVLPVGSLCAIFLALLTLIYSNGVKTAEHRTETALRLEQQDSKIDTQTMNIGIEAASRELSDKELRAEIERLDKKLELNFKWLIENGDFKKRGKNPLLK